MFFFCQLNLKEKRRIRQPFVHSTIVRRASYNVQRLGTLATSNGAK